MHFQTALHHISADRHLLEKTSITIIPLQYTAAMFHENHTKKYLVWRKANFSVCYCSVLTQGDKASAQRGHFHLNRGPWMPSGVTLSTVGTFVPAVTVCGAEEETSLLHILFYFQFMGLRPINWKIKKLSQFGWINDPWRTNMLHFLQWGQVQRVRHLCSYSWHSSEMPIDTHW